MNGPSPYAVVLGLRTDGLGSETTRTYLCEAAFNR
jgi:hypothetical protein